MGLDSTRQSTCPAEAQFRLFLGEALPGAAREPLETHVESCASCQQTLERLTSGSLLDPPPGCPFNPRCPHVMERCRVERPVLQQVQPDRWVACHLFDGPGAP